RRWAAEDEHPRLRGGNADATDRGGYLSRQRQAEPPYSGVERLAGAVPGGPGRGGVSARIDRYRAVYASARGSCRVEHDAGRRGMGPDISARTLFDGPCRVRALVAAAGTRGH